MMNWQEIVTSLILICTVGIIIFRMIKWIKPPQSAAHHCESGCSNCSVLELKNAVKKKGLS